MKMVRLTTWKSVIGYRRMIFGCSWVKVSFYMILGLHGALRNATSRITENSLQKKFLLKCSKFQLFRLVIFFLFFSFFFLILTPNFYYFTIKFVHLPTF